MAPRLGSAIYTQDNNTITTLSILNKNKNKFRQLWQADVFL